MSNQVRARILSILIISSVATAACGSDAVDSAAEDDATTDASTTDQATIAADTESSHGIDLDLFFDGALVEEPTLEACTLSGGTETTCYRLTVAGAPADNVIGPFCPTTIDATAADGGIWLDGENIYDIDGEFITNLAEIYDDENWQLFNEDGTVNVTETAEEFDGAARPNVDPSLQNHCVEGKLEWLPNGEAVPASVVIPSSPVPSGSVFNDDRSDRGVTLSGVLIAPPAPVDAILGAYTIAAFDDCGGHFNPVYGYHLHGAVGCSEHAVDDHEAIFGYALDGYAIHAPTEASDVDECGGHTSDELGYHYHANPPEENAVLSCMTGELAE